MAWRLSIVIPHLTIAKRLDVTEPESIEMAVQTIVAEAGGIYAVVNNAGQFLRGYFLSLSCRSPSPDNLTSPGGRRRVSRGP